jgi:TfoX/Sxy family transcriptional regulator of competence genes
MAYNEQLAARIRDHLTALRLPTEEKRMMGGLCFMVRDKMCVGVHRDRLMVRIDPETMKEALTQRGCTPMDFTGRPLKSFVFVSSEGWKKPADLAAWLTRALEFNPLAKSSKKSPPKNRSTSPSPSARVRVKRA